MSEPTNPTFRWLIASAVVVPIVMFAATVWYDYQHTLTTNDTELLRTSETFKQHALNVIETHQLIAERVNERLKGIPWEAISRDRDLQGYLNKIVQEYPQVEAIWLADPSGTVRNASEPLPQTSINVADRDYFQRLRQSGDGLFIGHVVRPRVLKRLNFNIACRRGSPDGSFNGVIVITVFPEYFSSFWSKVTASQESAVALVRGDGAVLARMPRLDPRHLLLPASSPQMKAMLGRDRGTFSAVAVNDGVKRFYAFHKLDKYDAYVLLGTNQHAALRGWRQRTQYYGIFSAAAMAVLLWFSVQARWYATREWKARQALQESEERLRLLGDNLPDSAVFQYVHNPDGTVQFQYISKGIEKLNGVSPGEVLQDAGVLHRQVLPEYQPKLEQAAAESARELSEFALEVPMRLGSGAVRWMRLTSRPRRLPGGKVVWDGVQTDITAHKEAEEAQRRLNLELDQRVAERTRELRQKDQLMLQQSRLAAMGEMIQNIAHQWRQPLNALGLTVQRLQLVHEIGEFNKDFLDQSVRDAMLLVQHMSKTIDDFRDFFKPDKEVELFEVGQAINRSLELIRASFQDHHIDIRFDLGADHSIMGYSNEYSQVILNILNNAKDALVSSGVGDPLVRISALVEEGRSVVTISDNAGGIPEEILPKIFDPHFTTKGPQGTGIGLFMAKSIIERSMNGELKVRNTESGAEFTIVV